MSKTYYVLSQAPLNDPGVFITSSIFNPLPGQVIAEFPVEEPSQAFNPVTFLSDGRIEEVQRLDIDALQKAQKFLANWRIENAIEPKQDVPVYNPADLII